jgi:hypothetical protein
MSRRRSAQTRLFAEIVQQFGNRGPGMSFALTRIIMLFAYGSAATVSGCLVTDTVDLPEEPRTPPVITAAPPYGAGSPILFNAATAVTTGLTIPITVRDEDITEDLQVRWRIRSNVMPAPGVTPRQECPLPLIRANRLLTRDWPFNIESVKFARGACSVVELIVSAHFTPCDKYPDDFDRTTNSDDEETIGHATFMVWETSLMPFDIVAAQQFLATCPTVDYRQPGATVTQAAMKGM